MDFWDILLEITDLARQIDRDHPEELQRLIPDAEELRNKILNKTQEYGTDSN